MGHWRKQEISFFVSTKCNLGCYYCYIPKLPTIPRQHEYVDIDFALTGMKDFFSWNPHHQIRFFSAGESTFGKGFDLMKEIRNLAYDLVGESLRVELQTNGYFAKEVADWVEENVDILWISCDGPPEIQDKQRPVLGGGRSSEVVLENIKRFACCSQMQLGVRTTISEDNFSRQTTLIDYFDELGVRYVCGAPMYASTVNVTVTSPPLLEFAKHFVHAFFRAKDLGMFYQTHLIVNFDEKVDIYCRACTPCPHLTSDGYVSCCDWASFGPEYLPGPLQQCIYGKYDRKTGKIAYDEEKISRIKQRKVEYLRKYGCAKDGCDILEHCAGGCIGKNIVHTASLYDATRDWCLATRYLAKRLPLNQGLFPCLHS